MTNFITPTSKDGQIQVTDQMRADAAASVANIEAGGGPYLYGPANADAKVVIERQEAEAGDFVVLGLGDKAVNLGKTPMFIVLSQHRRHSYSEGAGKDRKLIWDAARTELTNAQAEQVDLDWSNPRSARPYDSYMLLHVSKDGIDPNKIGPFRFKSSAHTATASKEWLSSIVGNAARGVPMFSCVWQLVGHMKDTGHGSSKYSFKATNVGNVSDEHPAYPKLKASWQHAQQMLGQSKSSGYAGGGDDEPDYGAMADEAIAEAQSKAVEPDDYVVADGGYGDEDYQTSLEPDVPKAAKEAGMDWDTPIRCGKDDDGILLKKPCCEMSAEEAKVAWKMAEPYVAENKEAALVHELLGDWADHKGWDIGQIPF